MTELRLIGFPGTGNQPWKMLQIPMSSTSAAAKMSQTPLARTVQTSGEGGREETVEFG